MAYEVMLVNSAIANMIRENKVQQMDNVIYAGSSEGMISMDSDILRLYKEKRITRDNALMYAINPDVLMRRM
jgi:twitching motility protein PilT